MKGAPRPYHHGNLREALLVAAEALLEAGGLQGLTLRELGRGLGVSHTSAQRHFADRRALLDTLAERGFGRLGTELGAAVADPDAGFDERLRRLAHAHVNFALRHPGLFRWMFEAKNQADPPASLMAATDEALSPAFRLFDDGRKSGAVVEGDPEHLSLAGFAAMQGLIATSIGGRFKGTPVEDLVDGVVERLVLGLRPR